MALLTKVQAVLLPIPLAIWALWHWRQRAILPLAIFGTVGALVFFAGWPWLWFAPIDHVAEYLGRTTDRIPLPVWYLGRTVLDRDVPWHYPFVLFAVTVPVGLHALGLVGVFGHQSRVTGAAANADAPDRGELTRAGWRDPAVQLLLACLLFPLFVFAVPGIAVYDGARLFLISFPLWAVLIGRGGGIAWSWLTAKRSAPVATIALATFVALQSYGVLTYRPVYLSYYNLLVGGLAGAERLGFEPTYWGDSVTASLLDAAAESVPEDGTLAVAPVLHQFQLQELLTQSPALRRRGVRLVEYSSENANDADALLVFFRKSSLSDELRDRLAVADPVARTQCRDVTLAGIYRLLPRDSP